jgi:serine/threonine protein kinase
MEAHKDSYVLNTDRPLIQSVNVFKTNKTRLAKSDDLPLTSRISESKRETKCLNEIQRTSYRYPLSGVSVVQTLKNQTKQPIMLEAARFRLEQKTSVWSKYDFVKTLGKGSFGEVQMITNKESKVTRALKIISKSHCNSSESYLEEIKILQQLVLLHIQHRIILMF